LATKPSVTRAFLFVTRFVTRPVSSQKLKRDVVTVG
jgi:hypothetical protein